MPPKEHSHDQAEAETATVKATEEQHKRGKSLVGQEVHSRQENAHARQGPGAARDVSKAAKVLALLKRPGGATLKELTKATSWLPHSIRGFLSGAVGKRMGLKVESAKAQGSERTYSLKP
jgi:hypothetical protein